MGGAGDRHARPRHGRLGAQAFGVKRVSRVSGESAGEREGCLLQGPHRALQRSRRSGKGVAADQERRTVPVLDYALALLSGALLALSFPKFGHPACAWLALTPLVVAVIRDAQRRERRIASSWVSVSLLPRRALLLGLLTGAVYFSGTLYWLVATMTTFGGLPAAGGGFFPRPGGADFSVFPRGFSRLFFPPFFPFWAPAAFLFPLKLGTNTVGGPEGMGGFSVG